MGMSSKRAGAQATLKASDANNDHENKKRKVGSNSEPGHHEQPQQEQQEHEQRLQASIAADVGPPDARMGGSAAAGASGPGPSSASAAVTQQQKRARTDKGKSSRRGTHGEGALMSHLAEGATERGNTLPAADAGNQPAAEGDARKPRSAKGQGLALADGAADDEPAPGRQLHVPSAGPTARQLQEAGPIQEAPSGAPIGLQPAAQEHVNVPLFNVDAANPDVGNRATQAAIAAPAAFQENSKRQAEQQQHRETTLYMSQIAGPHGLAAEGLQATKQAAPAETRPADAPPAWAPAARPTGRATGGPLAALRQAVDPGASGSSGSAPQTDSAAAGATAAGRPLQATGTTPVKAFVPVPIPRLDDVGQRDRSAALDLQRQIAELRALYDELKATKIQELEKVLAEQVEYTEEQVRHVEHKAHLWRAAAEHAEQKAKMAASQETSEQVAALKAEVARLTHENGQLLMRLAQHERELAQTQQAYHDLRAELLRCGGPDATEGFEGVEGMDDGAVEQPASDDVGGDGGDGSGGDVEADVAGQKMSPVAGAPDGITPMAAADQDGRLAGRAVGLQFPTPSPGIGVQFPTPGNGLKFPTPGVGIQYPTPGLRLNGLQGRLGSITSAPFSGSRSAGPGVSTECLRVVQMLPSLRALTPSIESRLASGAIQLETQLEAARAIGVEATDVTPTAADAQQGHEKAQGTGGKSRRSTGSPIDGICSVGQRKDGGANLAKDISFAHGMGAPEAFPLVQEQYSFVDLNPASAQKPSRPAETAPQGTGTAAADIADAFGKGAHTEKTQQGKEQACSVPAGRNSAALLAMAAATALPASPSAHRQSLFNAPLATAGSGVLQGALSPEFRGLGSATQRPSPSRQPPAQLLASGHVSPATAEAMAAAGVINSGSVMSNQDSCTISGLVARARAQQQLIELRAATNGAREQRVQDAGQAAAGGSITPMSESKRERAMRSPARSPKAVDVTGAQPAPSPAPVAEGPGPSHAQQLPPPSSPSPRTAKLIMYERMLDWNVSTVSLKPETCRLKHRTCGVSFELRETELDDEEAIAEVLHDQQAHGGGSAAEQPKCFVYTPLELGDIADKLPSFLKETICIPAHQRRDLLDLLNKAIKAAAAARQS